MLSTWAMKTDPDETKQQRVLGSLRRRRILIVEDDDELRRILVDQLGADGADVAEACNGAVAERLLLERTFDVLVTDIRMPGRSGLQLLHTLRERGSRIPVILMSGFADVSEIPTGAASRTLVFAKPFDVDDLRTAIANVDAYLGSDVPAVPRGRVFLAEDDADLRGILAAALREHGFAVEEASDGGAMVALLETAMVNVPTLPDAILMDIRMPQCDGLDVLRALRLSRWNVPVILMTAFPEDAVLQSALQLGASCLLAKPVAVEDVVGAVSTVTAIASRRRAT